MVRVELNTEEWSILIRDAVIGSDLLERDLRSREYRLAFPNAPWAEFDSVEDAAAWVLASRARVHDLHPATGRPRDRERAMRDFQEGTAQEPYLCVYILGKPQTDDAALQSWFVGMPDNHRIAVYRCRSPDVTFPRIYSPDSYFYEKVPIREARKLDRDYSRSGEAFARNFARVGADRPAANKWVESQGHYPVWHSRGLPQDEQH